MKSASLLLGWLIDMVERGGSDLYITHGIPPVIRMPNGFHAVTDYPMMDDDIARLLTDITTDDQLNEFEARKEFNMAIDLGGPGRYRVNLLRQQNHSAMVIRQIPSRIPTLEELKLPPLLGEITCEKRGLIIVVGGTGSGKSTSLAAMLNERNEWGYGHILTIEDPIEYVHEHKKCIITQREVGNDTKSFHEALKNSLRQRPDVILIGEIRDAEVMRHAINISETGHLALATLHANNANQAIERVASFFPIEERHQILLNLAFNLRGIISQRLVRTVDGGRRASLEILLNNREVQETIREGDTKGLKAKMEAFSHDGMQTFDSGLKKLFQDGIIDHNVLLAESDDREAIRQWLKARE